MKNLKDYLNEIDSTSSKAQTTLETTDMKTRKIMAPQNSSDDALWNSDKDRWSRKAKHPMNLSEKADVTDTAWLKGDKALYNDQEVEIMVVSGPRNTVGIMYEGHMTMVNAKSLRKLDESVMGGLTALSPLNRMMQLAGISSPSIISPTTESENEISSEAEIIEEADTTNMFEALFKANFGGEYRNNPEAARLATIGQVLVGLQSQISPLQGKIDPGLQEKLNVAMGLGASLISSAKSMLKPAAGE